MPKNALFKQSLDSKSSLLKNKAFGLLIIFFLAVKILVAVVLPENRLTLASDLTTDNILNAVNEQRSLRNLVTLNTNSKLTWAAQSKTDDMQGRHYFAHVDPDGHYIWDKIVAAGYTPYLELGENLAIEFYDTDSLIAAWMNSPTHRANLLNDGFLDQGMGLTFGDTSAGQYHSAVCNTFGALLVPPKPKTPAPPAPAPASKPVAKPAAKPKTLGIAQVASSSPAQIPSPAAAAQQSPTTTQTAAPVTAETTSSSAASAEPIFPRGGLDKPANAQSDFALPPQEQHATSSTSTNSSQPVLAVVGKAAAVNLTNYQINRYLVLVCGIFLLFLLLADIRTAIREKFGALDKKANNIVVLIISLIVVAFMYWL